MLKNKPVLCLAFFITLEITSMAPVFITITVALSDLFMKQGTGLPRFYNEWIYESVCVGNATMNAATLV